jgi:hypothetical protein
MFEENQMLTTSPRVVAALLQMRPERAASATTLDAAVRIMRAAFDASRAQ